MECKCEVAAGRDRQDRTPSHRSASSPNALQLLPPASHREETETCLLTEGFLLGTVGS